MKAFLPFNLLIIDAIITFIIRETVRISKCSELNSSFKQAKTKYN